MEKSAKYFAVGLFVTVTIFIFVGFLISIMGLRNNQNVNFYTVEFTDSITGLEEGSDVQYMGVKVGKVLKAYLVPGNNNLVRVDIAVDKETPVRAHTKIVLQTQGITGLVRMELSTENDDVLLPERVAGVKYPVLAGQSSRLYKALDAIPVITDQVAQISKQINAILTRNRASIERFSSEGLSRFTASTEEVKSAAASVKNLSDKLEENPSQILYPPSAQGVEIPR